MIKVEASSAGISKVLKMAAKAPTRAAVNQKKYRNKFRELNDTNARFMAFVSERAPWLVAEFFAKYLIVSF